MVVDPVVVLCRRVTCAALLLSLLLAPMAAAPVHADDVPETAQAAMAKARELLAAGDKKSLQKAWRRIEKLKPACTHSVDYWHFYLRLGEAMGKSAEALWADMEQVEKANPGCATFALLRARLTSDPYDKQEHLEKAVEAAPKDLRVKLRLIDHLLANDEEIDAEELVDEILEAKPDHIGALVRKGQVQLAGGYYNAALRFANEQIARAKRPEMFDLLAQAYMAIHDDEGKDVLADAHSAALEAVKLRADPAFVSTLAQVLEKRGKLDEARTTVQEHFDKSPSPLLAGLLGDYAFRTGAYEAAAKAFRRSALTSARSAKGLAACMTRLDKKPEAEAALRQLLAHDAKAHAAFAAYTYASLRKYDKALALLEGLEEEDAKWARGWILSLAGRPAAMKELVASYLEEDGVEGEWMLMFFTEALLRKAMGGNALNGFRFKYDKASSDAARKGIARPGLPERPQDLKANTLGLMKRVPTYVTAQCGQLFQPYGEPSSGFAMDEASLTFYYVMRGASTCPGDESRVWYFNRIVLTDRAEAELLGEGDWRVVKEEYLRGAKRMLGGDYKGAVKAFDALLKVEPYWHRIKLLRAAAEALSDPAKRKDAVSDARKAVADWPDDLLGRFLPVLMAAYAGVSYQVELQHYAVRAEALSRRTLDDL